MPTATGDSIEFEFACRCRLRRRRGRRRRTSGDGTTAAVAVSADDITLGHHAGISDAVVVGDQEGQEAPGEDGDDDEEEDEDREAEPEAAARVRLRAAGGELLGEAWAELPGAPEDWARYPLYSPGSVSVGRAETAASAGGAAAAAAAAGEVSEVSRATGLDRGEVIPAAPPTIGRRWGWGISRRDVSTTGSAAVARSHRWFRRRQSRDVAGEVRLRLGWVPSGLLVTVHRFRAVESARAAADSSDGATTGRSDPPLAGEQRRCPIIVRAEPGGGASDAHPIEVCTEGDGTNNAKPTIANVTAGGYSPSAVAVPPSPMQCDQLSTLRREIAADPPLTDEAGTSSESLFFVLDPSCLLGGIDMRNEISSVGDIGGGGGGARLIISMPDCSGDVDAAVDGKAGEVPKESVSAPARGPSERSGGVSTAPSAARAELLLFPGADPARRWVPLTDPTGTGVGEVDITVAWAVAPPSEPAASEVDSDRATVVREEGGAGDGTVAVSAADTSDAAGSLPPAKDMDGNDDDAEEAGTVDGSERRRGTMDSEGGMRGEAFPEPAQVVSRCFSMRSSDLVLRVSDLDVAVLVTMAKGIVRVRLW